MHDRDAQENHQPGRGPPHGIITDLDVLHGSRDGKWVKVWTDLSTAHVDEARAHYAARVTPEHAGLFDAELRAAVERGDMPASALPLPDAA